VPTAPDTQDTVEPSAQTPEESDADTPADAAPGEPSPGTFNLIRWLIETLRPLLERAVPTAKRILLTMNAPLRFVPPKLRPLVDYLALTLIMWVPIVWAIVWLVRQ